MKLNGMIYLYIDLDIWFTNKAHIIIEHLPEVIARRGTGLFYESEQVVEETHQKFSIFFGRDIKFWI